MNFLLIVTDILNELELFFFFRLQLSLDRRDISTKIFVKCYCLKKEYLKVPLGLWEGRMTFNWKNQTIL